MAGPFDVYRNKNTNNKFIVRDFYKTSHIEFTPKGIDLIENQKIKNNHIFFTEYKNILTIKEMFIPKKSKEGFEIYSMPLSTNRSGTMNLLYSEEQTFIITNKIANIIKNIQFRMPPNTIRKGFGFAAPFKEGLDLLPGVSKNAVINHTERIVRDDEILDKWNRGWNSKGKGRTNYDKQDDRLATPWLDEAGEQYPIDWYEIYGLLGEVTDWGLQVLRWSYYVHGRDKIGNEYWYAYDQGGHIQSGTGTFRFKPGE